ncbi:hypothetical protein Emag_006921 [Eimeria magna]
MALASHVPAASVFHPRHALPVPEGPPIWSQPLLPSGYAQPGVVPPGALASCLVPLGPALRGALAGAINSHQPAQPADTPTAQRTVFCAPAPPPATTPAPPANCNHARCGTRPRVSRPPTHTGPWATIGGAKCEVNINRDADSPSSHLRSSDLVRAIQGVKARFSRFYVVSDVTISPAMGFATSTPKLAIGEVSVKAACDPELYGESPHQSKEA